MSTLKRAFGASLALLLLAGCGVQGASSTAAARVAGTTAAESTKQGLFEHLIGLVSVMDDSSRWVSFEFGTEGMIFHDAVRKDPLWTVNGQPLEDAYGMIAAADGKLYVGRHAKDGSAGGAYRVGSWTIPKDLATTKFRSKVPMKLDGTYTYTVKRPLNPMAHITFVIDLKAQPPVVAETPQNMRLN